MIATLTGIIAQKMRTYAIIEVAGIGYRVAMNPPTLAALKTGETVRIWTHEHQREDGRELFGFLTQTDHAMFDQLTSVSGVGPKIGLAMLTLGPVAEIEKMIDAGDVDRLCRVPGIGRKTAQKIVLELRGKLVSEHGTGSDDDVLTALINLGYNRESARQALATVGGEERDVEKKLRAALRELGR